MRRTALLIGLCAAALPLRAGAQVTAEPSFRAGTWMVSVEVGGAAFSDLARTRARSLSDEVDLDGFSRRVSARTAGSAGGWISYWIGNGWGVRAGMSYVPTSFTVWNDETAQRALVENGSVDYDPSYASLDIWLANAAAVFRFPYTFGRVTPYGMVGGGLIRYDASDDAAVPPEARTGFAEGMWQGGAAMFGIGAAIPLQRRSLLLSFELTNHMSRTPLGARGGGELFELGGVAMQIDPETGASGEDKVGLTSHLRLALGLTLPVR